MTAIDTFLTRLAAPGGPGSLAGVLPAAFSIASAGPYPLAKHVAIAGSPVGGELMLGFAGLEVGPLKVARITPEATGREVTITLGPAQLMGHYELYGLETPRIELDTGGAMQPVGALGALDQDGAGAGDTAAISQKQFGQLVQANQQRDKLNQTANGRALIQTYDQYNDTYNNVFNTNAQLRKYWAGDGATAEMADYTSDALKTSAVVNPTDKTFGSNQHSYNMNAFAQQLNIWAACAKNYPDAAKAALAFKGQVNGQTGNSQSSAVPMTGDEVYAAVNKPTADTLTAAFVTGPQVHPLHPPLLRLVTRTHDTADITALSHYGFVLDDAAIARLQDIYAESVRVHDVMPRLAVHAGNCAAALGETEYRFALTLQPDGAITVKLRNTTLSLDALEMGVNGWDGEAGEVARERLNAASFIRGILADRIVSQLTRLLRTLAAGGL
jgi:hypothetical protein